MILRVDDLMIKGEDNSAVKSDATLKDVIVELSKKGLGIVSVVDEFDRLLGVVTDGDIRRQLERGADIYSFNAIDVMSRNPVTIQSGKFAVEALSIMKEKNKVSALPVIANNQIVGTVRLHEIIEAGIVG